MGLPERVRIREVGPREGFQIEGVGDPQRISLADKIRLIEALSQTGLKKIQIVSFVQPRLVPQMADAEEICRRISPAPGVSYNGTYLNAEGLLRALNAGLVEVTGKVGLTASETFSKKNQNRSLEEDMEMQRKMAQIYTERGIPLTYGSIMAAFGCNYEGPISLDRVLGLIGLLAGLAEEHQSVLETLMLADTMGWANPEQIRRTVAEVRKRWPRLRIGLHLHDTRGMGMANVYAALLEGVEDFDTSVGGLGGCPFAGFPGAAGNVCTEDVLMLCRELGIETGVDLKAMIACAGLAEEIAGHPLPGRVKSMADAAFLRLNG